MMPPMFNVLIPAFPCAIITLMLEIANFDLVEVGDYFDEWFEMPPTEPLTASLEATGAEGTYFLYNLGALSLILLIFIVVTIFVWLFSRNTCCGFESQNIKCYKRLNKVAKRQKTKFMWNGLLNLLVESHLIMCLSVFIQSTDVTHEWIGQKINYAAYILGCLNIFMVQLVILIWFCFRFDSMNKSVVRKRCGALFRDFNWDSRWMIAFRFFFFLKRMQLSYSVVYQRDSFFAQLITSLLFESVFLLASSNEKVQSSSKERSTNIKN